MLDTGSDIGRLAVLGETDVLGTSADTLEVLDAVVSSEVEDIYKSKDMDEVGDKSELEDRGVIEERDELKDIVAVDVPIDGFAELVTIAEFVSWPDELSVLELPVDAAVLEEVAEDG